ncbi:MAG: type II toxin-antitoxin system VapB family antitoxin [Deinococcota bacterium]|nr:type II toxin-antitoxin system VapB family antitoxin [Deinococcota bacterium]
MRQFSIKNARAGLLLEQITRLTGEGKTEAVVHALELYQSKLLGKREAEAVINSIRQAVHPYVLPAYRGKAPDKSEIEDELGMP